ncbi:uncharacterized protein PFL1_03804 [Pseudozyma flocculosa PF-1]|uniref:Large ribosomal subunit protein mL59 domain-containing protein n=2 Tax=Pseudozyma flocculosa TaxID=84751 RepID=A0A5C3EWJ0_9BASI|nr:uncharacterized protein PFL1_03804 [Pseudozyma flocculosa PF-1]EPQ28501.1 hypothetical protein PFL1_03804 [Pseudozyma flocculosa PF-1]SPO36422.1 uncharacterized protein PSFLO_01893 [Pseudozyma flocculosa]
MAFRQSLSLAQVQRNAQGDIVGRFLAKAPAYRRTTYISPPVLPDPSAAAASSSPSSSTSTSTATATTASTSADLDRPTERNPFKPWRSPTGRWSPSALSQRRQAELASLALQTGRLHRLPSGPKTDRLRARLAKLEEHRELEHIASQVRYAPPPAAGKADAQSEQDLVLATAKLEGYKGPYTGRKVSKMFKGSKVDRDAIVRRQNIKDKLQNMQTTVEEWQATKAENKAKFKPSLPF